MPEDKPTRRNPTDGHLDRQKGGGYQYEWELALEIALSALLPSFRNDWDCRSTEVPIPLHLRLWLGEVQSIDFDAASSKLERCEDINLRGSKGTSLFIQVKTSCTLTLPQVRDIVRKFLETEKANTGIDARYLIVAQNGATHDLHRHDGTLESFFLRKENKEIKKAYQEFKSVLGSDHNDLLGRVWLIRGPVYERLLNVTHHLVARHHKLDCGHKSERLKANERRAIIAERFKQRVCMKNEQLAASSMAEVVESAPTLRDLLRLRDYQQDLLPLGHHLELIEKMLGWELETTVGPYLAELVLALRPATKDEKPMATTIRDCLELRSFQLLDSGQLAQSQIRFLCLVRIAVLISGSLVDDHLRQAAKSGDPLATGLCWLGQNDSKVHRFQDRLRIALCRPPKGHEQVRDACCRLLQLETYLEGGTLREIEVSFTESLQEPDWLPTLNPLDETTPSEEPAPSPPENGSSADIRVLADEISQLRSLSDVGETGAKLAEPRLQQIYEACFVNGYEALLIDASEALAKALSASERRKEALEIFLRVSEAKMYQQGQSAYYWHHLSDLKTLTKHDSSLWVRKQCLDLQLEFRGGRFTQAGKILSSIDPDVSSNLGAVTDHFVVQARLMEARALLVHSGAKEAQQACLSLLRRIPREWIKERIQIVLLMTHAGYWSESAPMMKEAWRAAEAELHSCTSAENCSEADALKVCVLGLQWLLATKSEEFNAILERWGALGTSIEDPTVWAQLQFARTSLELRRRLFLPDTEVRRRGAHDIERGKNKAAKILDKARSDIASGSWASALGEVLTAIDVALITHDWQTLMSARQHLCQLSLVDGALQQALRSYTAYGAPFDNKSVEKELLKAVDESVLAETLPSLLAYDNSPALGRVWAFLLGAADRLTVDGHQKVLNAARSIVSQDIASHEDYFSRLSLLKLLSQLLRCPVDREQVLNIVDILLGLLESEHVQAFDDDIPRLVRRGFWSSTSLHPRGQAALLLLTRISALLGAMKQRSGAEALLDIVLSIGVNTKESQVKLKARDVLTQADAQRALAEWDALKSVPSPDQISTAFNEALLRCGQKLERTESGIVEHLRADSLGEVYPFLEHMTVDQLETLLTAQIDSLKDPDTVSERKYEIVMLLRQPVFQRCREKSVKTARRLLIGILNGQIEKNSLEKYRDQVNSSLFSGLKFDADANLRMHDAVCQALASFASSAGESEQATFFTALLQQTAVGNAEHCRHAAVALQVYFQASGSGESPGLTALLVKLLSHTDDTVCKEALKVLGDLTIVRKEIDDLYKSLLEPLVEQSYRRLDLRKGLAIFSRVATKSLEDHRHYQWVQQLNLRLQSDSNPLVRRLADLDFWADEDSDT